MKADPTISDVISAIDSLSVQVVGMDGKLDELKEDAEGLKEDVHEMNRRMGNVERTAGSIEEVLEGVALAVDKDSLTLYTHGKRIAVLEKAS